MAKEINRPHAVTRTSQPQRTPTMNPMNVKNIPLEDGGGRGWSHGLLECFGDCWTCCFALICPCMVYSHVKSRLDSLRDEGQPHPHGGKYLGRDCMFNCFNGWILQVGQRTDVRRRYNIEGDSITDCFAAALCSPCQLTQQSREIALEEWALRRNAMLDNSNTHELLD
ncbi:PLAC8-domain-containing protein [Schizopora paradoxa]|uniref:PLAC8-domain-containing protein n=1 Tax=Schizopora paradoxa TaxID=27342 RepID=A0A0H2RU46_9AGAM|nr:PLAC8-domain-containing protein [Schizopora paradoxa]